MSYTVSHSVAFSSSVQQAMVKFIIPMRSTNDVWSFLQPLSMEVWICLLTSVPVFILLCGLLDFLSSGLANWTAVAGFAVRNILVENRGMIPATRAHQKAAFLGWIWFAFIITTLYAGNLLAIITTPRLIMPIRDAEDLLSQDDITLVVEDGLAEIASLKNLPLTSIWRRVYERLEYLKFHDEEYWPSECFSNSTQFSGRHAALCEQVSIKEMLHESFTADEQCNWYMTEDSFLEIPSVMLFQVGKAKRVILFLHFSFLYFQKGSLYLDDANEIINMAKQMGFFDDKIQKYTPNASRCLTKAAIGKTNREKGGKMRVLRLEDKYGMFLLLCIGLAGALLAFAGEHIAHKMKSKKGSIERRNIQQGIGRHGIRRRALETFLEIELSEHPKKSNRNNPRAEAVEPLTNA